MGNVSFMNNPLRGDSALDIAARSYTLRWGTNAMCALEGATDRGVFEIAFEMASWAPPSDAKGKPLKETEQATSARMNRVKIGLVRAVFWAMLQDHHKDITIDQAGDLMTEVGGLAGVMAAITTAFERGNAPETKGTRPQAA